jgi:hypothetical protein
MHVLIVFIIVEVATIYVTTIRVCQASSQMFMFIFLKKIYVSSFSSTFDGD